MSDSERMEKSLTLYDCFCNVHLPVFYTLALLYPCKILRLRASLFARHFAQDDKASGGVSPPPCSANRRYYIAQHYSAASEVSPRPYSANGRYYIAQHYSAAGGVSPPPCSANRRYFIAKLYSADSGSVNNTAMPRSARRFYNEHQPSYTVQAFMSYQ